MRISQLAAAGDVPVATVKYYLREGLVPEGRLTSPTQAQYDESHVQRLRLVRALLGPAGLSVAAARELLAHVDDPPASRHDLLGLAHHAVQRPRGGTEDLTRVSALFERWGWCVSPEDGEASAALAGALRALDDAGVDVPDSSLDVYARAMAEVAEDEIERIPTDSAEAAVRFVALGTVLVEPVLLALRRLAQQDASRRHFGAEAS